MSTPLSGFEPETLRLTVVCATAAPKGNELVVLILLKEGQRFELWEATNLSSFQDYHHKPLGQPSNVVLKHPIRVLCCVKATIGVAGFELALERF